MPAPVRRVARDDPSVCPADTPVTRPSRHNRDTLERYIQDLARNRRPSAFGTPRRGDPCLIADAADPPSTWLVPRAVTASPVARPSRVEFELCRPHRASGIGAGQGLDEHASAPASHGDGLSRRTSAQVATPPILWWTPVGMATRPVGSTASTQPLSALVGPNGPKRPAVGSRSPILTSGTASRYALYKCGALVGLVFVRNGIVHAGEWVIIREMIGVSHVPSSVQPSAYLPPNGADGAKTRS